MATKNRQTRGVTRRTALTTLSAAAALALRPDFVSGQDVAPADTTKRWGRLPNALGARSPAENPRRTTIPTSSRTPLQDLHGTITPSDLHYERHHAGVAVVDPQAYRLTVHGMVDRPLTFTLQDLKRFPSVSRLCFLECSGNFGGQREDVTPQDLCGLTSQSEWTGVMLSTVFKEVGAQPRATWFLAEGQDAAVMTRSIPLKDALGEAMLAYAQNGEALRPEQGYPLRLVVPGWEGNVNIKWLGRIQLVDQPYMTHDEAASYTDFMPDGKARAFTFVMEAKSVITRPAGGQTLEGHGFYDVTGLAWSGRGTITRVEVSTDEGKTWQDAHLNHPVLPKAATRFSLPWQWDGSETTLQSRCTDDTGYVQPTRADLIAVRGLRPGPDGFNHYNGIKTWFVHHDGKVSHE
jgi:sulfane dehydrogenase subunit SoxC